MLWAFSIWLESVAILPQLFMLQRTGEAETITTHYLFALGAYRALYIPNWIYRYFVGEYVEIIAVLAGIVQTVLYSDFFYIYWTKYVSLPLDAECDHADGVIAECYKGRSSTCRYEGGVSRRSGKEIVTAARFRQSMLQRIYEHDASVCTFASMVSVSSSPVLLLYLSGLNVGAREVH